MKNRWKRRPTHSGILVCTPASLADTLGRAGCVSDFHKQGEHILQQRSAQPKSIVLVCDVNHGLEHFQLTVGVVTCRKTTSSGDYLRFIKRLRRGVGGGEWYQVLLHTGEGIPSPTMNGT